VAPVQNLPAGHGRHADRVVSLLHVPGGHASGAVLAAPHSVPAGHAYPMGGACAPDVRFTTSVAFPTRAAMLAAD